MNNDFNALLQQTAEEFANAEVFNDWLPDDGDYNALIADYKEGVKETDTSKMWWMRLTGRLLAEGNPDLDQREFTLGYFSGKAPGILKGAVSVLNGAPVKNIADARAILLASIGAVVELTVSTGKQYRNVRITKLVAPPAPTPDPQAPAAGK